MYEMSSWDLAEMGDGWAVVLGSVANRSMSFKHLKIVTEMGNEGVVSWGYQMHHHSTAVN